MSCQLSSWHGCSSFPQTNSEETIDSRSKHGSLMLTTNHPPRLFFSLRLMARTLILLLREYSNVLSPLDFLPPMRSARNPKGHLVRLISSGPIYAALGLWVVPRVELRPCSLLGGQGTEVKFILSCGPDWSSSEREGPSPQPLTGVTAFC